MELRHDGSQVLGEVHKGFELANEWLGATRLQVVNTHFGLRRRERMLQARTLAGDDWLGSEECAAHPAVLAAGVSVAGASCGLASTSLAQLVTDRCPRGPIGGAILSYPPIGRSGQDRCGSAGPRPH